MSDGQPDDTPAGVDDIIETLLDSGAAYLSDEEAPSRDDVLPTVDLPPFGEGPPVRVTAEPQARADARSATWQRLRALPPRQGMPDE